MYLTGNSFLAGTAYSLVIRWLEVQRARRTDQGWDL